MGLRYVCSACANTYQLPGPWRCACGGALNIDGEPGAAAASGGIWRHAGQLRAPAGAEPVTLGEGNSPLIRLSPGQYESEEAQVLLKLDSLSPTGSFKDRGSALMITVAKWEGCERVVCDSSGNAGSSVAAYSAAAGLSCRVFVPVGTSSAKLAQIKAYGAEVVEINGDREEVSAAARDDAATAFYASHYWNPFFLEGTKTAAFEIVEQLGGPPEHVITPVGHGTLFLGLELGFREMLAARQITRMPRIHAAQSQRYAALAVGSAADLEGGNTVAEGIRIRNPVRKAQMLAALEGSGGTVVPVADPAIERAHERASRRGHFIEMTSATALAALERLQAEGTVAAGERVVVVITGHGLKTVA